MGFGDFKFWLGVGDLNINKNKNKNKAKQFTIHFNMYSNHCCVFVDLKITDFATYNFTIIYIKKYL